MIRVIRNKSLFKKLTGNLGNFKLFGFLGVMTLIAGLTLYLTTQQQDLRQRASTYTLGWGNIANSERLGEYTRGVFLFAGPPNPNSLQFYTRTPLNSSQFDWKDSTQIDNLFNEIKEMGTNVIKLSWWGSNLEYMTYAPTYNSIEINNLVFSEALERNMLVAPLIEVSPAFRFYEDFPTNTTNLENNIKSLLTTYGKNQNWLIMYDQDNQARKVVWLIETIHLGSVDTTQFAQAFDIVANNIERETGHKIGFIIDPTPLPPNGSYEGPDPVKLKTVKSILAINPFNITSDGNTESERLVKAEEILVRWKNSGIPLIAPVLPGYDDQIVRPPGQIYGDNPSWRSAVERLTNTYQTAGITLDVYNGFTEGYSFTPTVQNGYENYNLASRLFLSLIPPTPTPQQFVTPTAIPVTPTSIPATPTQILPTPNISVGTINVSTYPSIEVSFKIVNSLTGKLAYSGSTKVTALQLSTGKYYISFSSVKTNGLKTPKVTHFNVNKDRLTEIVGNFRTGKTNISYR